MIASSHDHHTNLKRGRTVWQFIKVYSQNTVSEQIKGYVTGGSQCQGTFKF